MRKSIFSLALAALLAAPGLALAHQGLYVDGAVGRASVDDLGIDDNDTGFRIGAGWRFVENFGAEIGFVDLGKLEDDVAIGGLTNSVESDGMYIGVSGRLPLTDEAAGFFLSARAGMFFWDAEGRIRTGTTSSLLDESNNDFYLGIGGGYDFNEQFGVSLSYDRYKVSDGRADFDYDMIGVTGEVRF